MRYPNLFAPITLNKLTMRNRIVTSPSFGGNRVLGAILFEMTMDRQFDGQDAAQYLWNTKQVVPFLKVDKGLADEVDGAKLMKPASRSGSTRSTCAMRSVASPSSSGSPTCTASASSTDASTQTVPGAGPVVCSRTGPVALSLTPSVPRSG